MKPANPRLTDVKVANLAARHALADKDEPLRLQCPQARFFCADYGRVCQTDEIQRLSDNKGGLSSHAYCFHFRIRY